MNAQDQFFLGCLEHDCGIVDPIPADPENTDSGEGVEMLSYVLVLAAVVLVCFVLANLSIIGLRACGV